MSDCKRDSSIRTALAAATILLLIPGLALAQTPAAKASSTPSMTSAKQDRWLHVRPSGTEPIIRLIAEAPSRAAAEQLVEEGRRLCAAS